MNRGKAKGLRNKILTAWHIAPDVKPAGLHLGNAPAIHIELVRLHRVAERTALCLYCNETGARLPDTHEVIAYSGESSAAFSKVQKADFRRTFTVPLSEVRAKTIGTDVFAYKSILLPEFRSAWGLEFYRSIRFIVLTTAQRPGAETSRVALPNN
jgi:hypothetical protein